MRVGVIESINRYPVKSMAGETLDQVELGVGGIPGDRCWAVRDEKRGEISGAKKFPALMDCASRLAEPALEGASPLAEITLPDGTRASTTSPDIGERLSSMLGHPVSLWPLQPADALDHYRRGPADGENMEAELRAVFARTPDEALPDLGAFPPELFQFASPPGSYFDAFPLLLLTTESLATLQSRAPESRFDVRRFRPNFLVGDVDSEEPFPELAWLGKTLALGEAVVDVVMSCPRCVMTTHGFDDLAKDPSIMRALVREAGGSLGVYAKPRGPGRVRTGDEVRLVQA